MNFMDYLCGIFSQVYGFKLPLPWPRTEESVLSPGWHY